VPDWIPPKSFPGVAHAGYRGEFPTSWFVVFHSTDPDARTAALVAERIGDNEWEALWTFDDERIRAVNRYIERTLRARNAIVSTPIYDYANRVIHDDTCLGV
jgi:hypothetical protein